MDWINTHGFALLSLAYVCALIISAMPPLPASANWWQTWGYSILQVLGANADKVLSHDPRLKAFTQIQDKSPDGTVVTKTNAVLTDPK